MRIHWFFGLISLLSVMILASSQAAPTHQEASPSPTSRFPEVEGSSLEGRRYQLPGDFEGELNLALVAFRRDQQEEIDTWLPAARALAERYTALRYYELPAIKKVNRLIRAFINRGMRSGIPDRNARALTITLYIDKEPFKQALDIPHEDTIYLFLVDDAGQVIWRAQDAYKSATASELERVIASQLTGEEPSVTAQTSQTTEIATLGGGCFWCLEAVFDELKGVLSAKSGYSGGSVPNPTYQQVCTGTTGHAEVVQIEFDPEVLSYQDLLGVFFSIHDPTTLNRQGADVGTQYRSVIYYHSDEQRQTAKKLIERLNNSGRWDSPIVTEVAPFSAFYVAEDYHQEYYRRNSDQPYCRIVIDPKLAKFRKQFQDRRKPIVR